MKYLLMIYSDEKAYAARSPEDQKRGYEAYMAYTEALKKAGAFLGSDRLRPTDSATTVRVVNGKSQVLNGPYTETKEQLGGYYIIECANLDEAIEAAGKLPAVKYGSVEVRPLIDM